MNNGLDNAGVTEIAQDCAADLPSQHMTLTEQKLCKIWRTAAFGGDWWDLYQQMRAISDVLKVVGKDAAADMFFEAGQVALARCVYDLQHREVA